MARTWLSIRVDLIEGHGERCWPRPGRIFAAARSHTFKQLADAIDDAFARWDRSHLQEFTLSGSRRLCHPDPDWETAGVITEDYQRVRLSRLGSGDRFVYVFDLGDDWTHLCTVGAQRVDPVETLGILPDKPLPYWGWGDIPDQYRRRWDGDDGESPQPENPGTRAWLRHLSPGHRHFLTVTIPAQAGPKRGWSRWAAVQRPPPVGLIGPARAPGTAWRPSRMGREARMSAAGTAAPRWLRLRPARPRRSARRSALPPPRRGRRAWA